MIVTLAGHVDHGKTALVHALTGIDTDRLEAEKRRSLTIELGFAYGEFDSHRIGFVDVPGHHRFVRNMIAGVSSRQFALLVVAADEGPMPQTAEHLDILETLGIGRGMLAMTRSDLADDALRAKSQAKTENLVKGSFLDGARTVWCSSRSGEGLDELRSALREAARGDSRKANQETLQSQHFRLSIDRAFNLTGAGLVVTGAVHSGQVREGDSIVAGRLGRGAKVRSIRVSDLPADSAMPGDRAALNLSGLDLEQVSRGDWVLARQARHATKRISLELRAISRLARPLQGWTSVHLHHGTEHVTGRLALLNASRLEAGAHCIADCLLDQPIIAKWGDRMLIRDAGSEHTLGGGPVIDTCLAQRQGGLKRAARIALLEALAEEDIALSLVQALRHTPLISLQAYASLRNVPEALALSQAASRGVRCIEVDSRRELMLEAAVEQASERVVNLVTQWHLANPTSGGMRLELLGKRSELHSRILRHVISSLVAGKRLAIRSGEVFVSGFKAKLGTDETRLLRALEESTAGAPTLGDLAKLLLLDAAAVSRAAKRLEAVKEIVFLNDRRIICTEKLEASVHLARSLESPEGFTVREFRDSSGHGRNSSIDILEYLDRTGVTRRIGDRRQLIGEPRQHSDS